MVGLSEPTIVAIVAADVADLYEASEVDIPAEDGLGAGSGLSLDGSPRLGEQATALLEVKGAAVGEPID